jgi:pSer/pThr/pTyr-binding forkhead associated (FHA) protein
MATLQKLGDEEPYALALSQVGIGRAPDNEIVIDDDTVSAYHALITIRPAPHDETANEYILEDLDSTNKTFVNNREISSHRLKEGDIVRVGGTRLKFSIKEHAAPQKEFQKTRKIDPKKLSKF